MPSRRSHTKSRLGCDTCRTRRVKCSELGPPCAQCAARGCECTYFKRDGVPAPIAVPSKTSEVVLPYQPTAVAQAGTEQSPASTDSSRRTASTAPPSDLSRAPTLNCDSPLPASSRLQELALMRWWCTHACRSLVRTSATTPDVDLWLGPALDMAFEYSFLMDVILAVSATQIAAESKKPSDRSAYASLALEYQSRAITAARPQLMDVGPTNCHALFAFSVLNIPTSIILAQLPIGISDVGKSPVESILVSAQWIESIVGLMVNAEQWLRHGPFIVAFDRCADSDGYDEKYRPAMKRLFSLLAQSEYADRAHAKQFDLFSRGIELLEAYFLREKAMAIGWPCYIGPGFFEEVVAKNTIALLLTMHWGVLLHSLEMWWAVYTGTKLVEQIGRDLSNCDDDQIREAIHWSRVQVGLELGRPWNP